MWARNLLLVGVCLAVVPVFRTWVLPPKAPRARPEVHLQAGQTDDIQPAVRAVDTAFEDLWQRSGIQPASRADDLVIARRLSLALLGTIPSLEEIRLFESRPTADRLDWWLRTILADRRSADYRAERLARALVGTEGGPFILFRRRRFVSWLADGLHANRPYDAIMRHMIADSGIWTDTPATNFITAAIKPDSDEDPDPNRLAAQVARGLLGVRLDCAECHDHPFQPWKQRDFQGLAAFFGQTRRTGTGIRDRDGQYEAEDRKSGKRQVVAPAVPYQPELLPRAGTRRQRLAAWVTDRNNRAFSRAMVNRAWALLFGSPLVAPVDNIAMDAAQPAALDLLADDFAGHGYDGWRLLRVIAGTRVFQLDSQDPASSPETTVARQLSWATFPLTRLRPEQMVSSLMQAASLQTNNYESHILLRIIRQAGQSQFIARYGDLGSDEFDDRGGTVPQRLLMMNGDLVRDMTKDNLIGNSATRIAVLAPDDDRAIETMLLVTLTRRPTESEAEYFSAQFAGASMNQRKTLLEDLCWSLLNTTEFAWNH